MHQLNNISYQKSPMKLTIGREISHCSKTNIKFKSKKKSSEGYNI